jgi:hypothetical protein
VQSYDLNRLLDEPVLDCWLAPRKYIFWIFWNICLKINKLRHFGVARDFDAHKSTLSSPSVTLSHRRRVAGWTFDALVKARARNDASLVVGRKGHHEQPSAQRPSIRQSVCLSANTPRSGFVQPADEHGPPTAARCAAVSGRLSATLKSQVFKYATCSQKSINRCER